MISSDDMDSNDLWAQRNDSTSSLFWKSDYKTTARKLFVISFTFLSNLQVPQFENIESANVNQGVLDQNFWSLEGFGSGILWSSADHSIDDEIQFEKYEDYFTVKKLKMLSFIFTETKFSFRLVLSAVTLFQVTIDTIR